MITVRQGSKHRNKTADNDVKITLMSPLFISVKKINLLLALLPSFSFYNKYGFEVRRLFIGWKHLKKIFTYYK